MTSEGIRIPRWAIVALMAASALLGIGYRVGAQIANDTGRLRLIEEKATGLDFRLCRIEKALNIALYQTCQQ